jgi:septin family protein
VVGTKSSGKSSFISLLKHTLASSSLKRDNDSQQTQTKGNFVSSYVETEMDSERVGLTLWDSVGLEKSIVDLQLREMSTFIESKFEETFAEEQKVMRSPGFRDTHIHCVFLVLDPLRLDANLEGAAPGQGGLDDGLEVQVLRAMWEKTVVIPVIAKADTLTVKHMAHLKRAVWKNIKDNSMNPLDALELEDDEEEADGEDSDVLVEEDEDADFDLPIQGSSTSSHSSKSSTNGVKPKPASKRASHIRHPSHAGTTTDEEPYLPLSILSPDPYTLPKTGYATDSELSRVFPWGSASPLNPQHCDFTRLRDSVFLEWRGDLRELSRTRWYEQWRTSRLRNVPGTKMRIKGGVTPVAAVPKEGRGDVRNFSSGGVGPAGVPRSVSGGTQATAGAGTVPVGMAVSTPASAY